MTEDKRSRADLASNPSGLREEIQDFVDIGNGETVAYVDVDAEFNLNAFGIGLGLANINYEPDVFPGLVYHIDRPDVTAILFDGGQIAVVDGPDKNTATEAIQKVGERLQNLELYDGTITTDEIEVSQV